VLPLEVADCVSWLVAESVVGEEGAEGAEGALGEEGDEGDVAAGDGETMENTDLASAPKGRSVGEGRDNTMSNGKRAPARNRTLNHVFGTLNSTV
jgi:hypothetical protein